MYNTLENRIVKVTLLVSLLFFSNCKDPIKLTDTKEKTITSQKGILSSPSKLFVEKCMICHDTKEKTSKTMLAPPFYQIKKRYKQASINQEDFVEIMSEWVKNPSNDNILIPDAVSHFGLMPKLDYTDKDIGQISQYIYHTNFPKPDWFDTHEILHKKKLNKMTKCK